jgi:UDP-N-acetylmuramoyl-L-alanyl-D-glutamate--2,6-diaminopimelate ligase
MSKVRLRNHTLASWLGVQGEGCDQVLGDIYLDSRSVGAGDVFVALSGATHNAGDYAPAAAAQGAAAVLVETGSMTSALQALSTPVVEVPALGQRIGELAAGFYRLDETRVVQIGITGTNGKTTVSWLLAQILTALGKRCALVGTLGWGFAGELSDTGMTTPDALSMARIISALDQQGAQCVAIEVSSHGLAQQRTAGLDFTAAVFTNLTQDHLDYHQNMEAYGEAKRRLFIQCKGLAVINTDDDYGCRLFADEAILEPKLSYSLSDSSAQVYCETIEYGEYGSRAALVTPWGEAELLCPLPGDFNLLNALACITLLGAWGYPLSELLPALAVVRGAPGRMEVVHSDGVMVIVDYAHTPDALQKVLQTVRRHVGSRLWVVIGCGGNRDRSKRPRMGAAATALADEAILTSDNPRDEAPEAILADMSGGLTPQARAKMVLEVDRQRAIHLALQQARAGDVVVIAGKGHEAYQEIRGQRLPFSDRACVQNFYAGAGAP